MTASTSPPTAPADATADAPAQPSVALIFLIIALLVGGVLRALPLFSHPFALNDGGLFWAMTRAVEDGNFVLPARVFYPTAVPNIPFCYPPLGFYVAAAWAKIGVPLAVVFRWLPWAWSLATIWGFWRLARAFCRDEKHGEWAAGAATLGWSLLPWSFAWHVMGGGLTRAPGLLWAFLAIEAALRLWRDAPDRASADSSAIASNARLFPARAPRLRLWLALTFWLALTLLTHLERARFAVVAVALVWLFYGRNRRGLEQFAGALAGAAALSAPWWGVGIARFGLAPFRAAASSGGGDWGSGSALQRIAGTAGLGLSGEAIVPTFHLVGLAGLGWLLWRRRPFLPLWCALILLLEVRSGRVFVIAPLALSAGLLLADLPRARAWLTGALALWLCVLSSVIQSAIPALSPDDVAAMKWAATGAPPDARFFVVPSNQWAMDAPAEWFPALTSRASVLTVQGAEWLPGGEFRRRVARHNTLRRAKSWREAQAVPGVPAFDWVWRPANAPAWEPGANWRKVWSRGNAAIWRKVE